jgi:hypothetical protein
MSGVNKPTTRLLGERYRLVERLGAGGMSVVWRGYDEVLGRQVAVKVLASRLATDRSFRHRIRIEAKAAARLCHPHITNVYDYGESVEGGVTIPYVVMELVDGRSVAAHLGRHGGRMPWRDAVVACVEVASALATAHSRGVVHRDVTPGNVMLTGAGAGAKVVDFGISALVGERDADPDGAVLGTPAYLAPERLDGGQVTAATDVYALGLLLYRMVTGRLPWAASTKTDLLRAHLYREPAPMPAVEGLPAEVAELCERCLAKEPVDRPSSIEVARTLAEAVGVPAVVPVSPAPTGAGTDPGDEALLANAGTTILPWSAATDALTLPRSGGAAHGTARDRRSAGRQRVQAMAVGAGLLTVTGVVWAATSGTPAGGGAQPAEAAAAAATPACQVDYALRKDSGKGFDADLRVTNSGAEAVPSWRLTFAFPGDQVVTGGSSGQWQQQGRAVAVRADGTLAPGGSAALALSGRYVGTNPLPVEFQLNDSSCAVRLSAAPGGTPGTAPTAARPTDAGRAAGNGTAARGNSGKGSGKPAPARDSSDDKGKDKKDH